MPSFCIIPNMRNPWKELPNKRPFILPIDENMVYSFNYTEKNRPRFEILPAPFLGRPTNAEIFLLSLNPGFKEFDITAQNEDPDYVEHKRLSMEFKSRFPFFIIDPEFPGKPGYDWWQKKLKELIGLYGVRHVAEKIMCIQYFPYQSASYKHQPHIPSQEFSFYLVKQAINFKKIIVVMRGKRYWFKSIPELINYPFIELKNPRSPTISHGNMAPESFRKIQSALR